MKIMQTEMSATILDAVQRSLLQAARHAPGEVGPAAILWPDADGQWQSLIPQLRNLMPQLLILGTCDPEQRQGPAIWIRCVIEGALPEVLLPERAVPVIYMPNVSRQTLRNVEECPWELQPLVELQYRGTVWCQRNGKDWTAEAFLVSEDTGLGLDVSKDIQTRRAMLGALGQLAVTPLVRLRGKRLEAEDFDKLVIEDTPRNLLEWMNDPQGSRQKWDNARWLAFQSRCKAEYGFDPKADGELVAAERLGMRDGVWLGVWQRYSEAPELYPGIPYLLSRAKPAGRLLFVKETWPDENAEEEKTLRKALLGLADLKAAEGRDQVAKLESIHGVRRKWVWSKLGHSALAIALSHLTSLAIHTRVGLGGDSLATMMDLYTHGGYLADDAVLRALAEVKSAEDHEAVSGAIRAIYLPWLQDAAEHFQKVMAASPLPTKGDENKASISAEGGTCILFVDSLRYDLGQRLAALAEDRKLRVSKDKHWAALPTVTSTAKPAVSPVVDQIIGHRLGEDFVPIVAEVNQPVTPDRFRNLLTSAGYEYLLASETGNPQAADARAWTEYGEFDKLGHDLQAKIAGRIDDQLELLVDRIEELLEAGWREVRVVTDHGWLLVPGGLPATSLPKYLTESRWSRCAAIKTGAHVTVPTAGWFWNPTEVFAFSPGISCFGKGFQYAHGGVSLQECVISDLIFSSDVASAEISAKITEVHWRGMRCRISIEPVSAPVTVDIRTKVGDSTTSITAPRQADSEGKAGLLVENDSLEGTTVSVVLLDTSGRVVVKRATTVGGEE